MRWTREKNKEWGQGSQGMCGFACQSQDFWLLWDKKSLKGVQRRSDVVWHVERTMVAFEFKRSCGHFWVQTEISVGNHYNNTGGEMMMVVKSGRQQWTSYKWPNSGYTFSKFSQQNLLVDVVCVWKRVNDDITCSGLVQLEGCRVYPNIWGRLQMARMPKSGVPS